MMRFFPLGVHNWVLSDFDNTIAGTEADFYGCFDDIDVRPLELMIVDIVADLAE